MQLTVKEASKLLKLPESVIYRLIRKKEIPAYQVSKSFLFNRVELLEWAISNNHTVSPEIVNALSESQSSLPAISEALEEGGVYYDICGSQKQEALQAIVEGLALKEPLDKQVLLAALIAREMLGSTAVGNGIAIPHVRNPIVLKISRPMIVLSFLKTPIDFGALDARPVDTLFLLISTTVRVHLHMLARLSFLLHDPAVQKKLKSRAASPEIIDTIRTCEKVIAPAAASAQGRP